MAEPGRPNSHQNLAAPRRGEIEVDNLERARPRVGRRTAPRFVDGSIRRRTMPTGPKGERRPAEVSERPGKLRRYTHRVSRREKQRVDSGMASCSRESIHLQRPTI